MASTLERIVQADWGSGSDQDVARHLVSDKGFYEGLNALLEDDGAVSKRGGASWHSNAAFGTGGRMLWEGYLEAGRRTVFASPDDFGVLDADDETPINVGGAGVDATPSRAVVDGLLFIGGGYIYGGSRKTVQYATGTISVTSGSAAVVGAGTAFLANVDPGMLIQVGNGRVYAVASVADNTNLTLASAYAGSSASGVAYTAYPLYTITGPDPYPSAPIYAAVQEKLVACSGRRASVSGWRDPHSWGANDYHATPEGTEIIAAYEVGDRLALFTSGGIWTVLGLIYDLTAADGSPQRRMDQISRELVAWGGAGIAAYGQALVVPTTSGVFLIDGISQPRRISRGIERAYQRNIRFGYRPNGAVVFNDHYFLPIGDDGGAPQTMLVCRLDLIYRGDRRSEARYPWTTFEGAGAGAADFAVRTPAIDGSLPYLLMMDWSEGRIARARYFELESRSVDQDDSVHAFSLSTRDYETGGLTINRVRRGRLLYELDGDPGSTIEPRWATGEPITGTQPKWGEVQWNDFRWGSALNTEFGLAGDPAPESEGRDAHTFDIEESARYVRLRFRSSDRVTKLRIRSLELFVAPSNAIRHSKENV